MDNKSKVAKEGDMGFNEKLLQQIASSGERDIRRLLARQMNISPNTKKAFNAIKNLLRSGIIAKGKQGVRGFFQNLIRGVLRGIKGVCVFDKGRQGRTFYTLDLKRPMHGDTVLAIKLGEEGVVVSVVKGYNLGGHI